MKQAVKCKVCNRIYEIDLETVDRKNEYWECPFCGYVGLNPFYEKR